MQQAQKTKFIDDGYLILKDLIDTEHLKRIKRHLDPINSQRKDPKNFGNSGGFIQLDPSNNDIRDLLVYGKTLEALNFLGGNDIKLHSFYASIKQPNSTELPWHSDIFYPYDRKSTPEVFVIYYLEDTNQHNGCLRVIPGSHLWSKEDREKCEGTGIRDGELSLQTKVGDVFIGDRRLLHATHPNDTKDPRSCITISYALNFNKLNKATRGLIISNQCLKGVNQHG